MHVAVIGAGPVGLTHAIDERLLNHACVTVFEKRDCYVRDHVVHVSDDAIKALIGISSDYDRMVRSFGDTGIPIKTLEKELLVYARSIGITVLFSTPIASLKQLHSFDKIIVAAGVGCHGSTLAPNPSIVVDNGALLQIKFTLTDTKAPKSRWQTALDNFLWHVGYTTRIYWKRGSTQAQLFVAMDRDQYNSVRDIATFRHPATLDQLESHSYALVRAMGRMARKALMSAHGVNEKVVAVDTRSYRLGRVQRDNVWWVGDAAGGVPYQQSLNMALQMVRVVTREPETYAVRYAEHWENHNDLAMLKADYIRVANWVCRNRTSLLLCVVVVLMLFLTLLWRSGIFKV